MSAHCPAISDIRRPHSTVNYKLMTLLANGGSSYRGFRIGRPRILSTIRIARAAIKPSGVGSGSQEPRETPDILFELCKHSRGAAGLCFHFLPHQLHSVGVTKEMPERAVRMKRFCRFCTENGRTQTWNIQRRLLNEANVRVRPLIK